MNRKAENVERVHTGNLKEKNKISVYRYIKNATIKKQIILLISIIAFVLAIISIFKIKTIKTDNRKLTNYSKQEIEAQDEIQEALTAIQTEKEGNAKLQDLTQDELNKTINNKYIVDVQDDASSNNKIVTLNKDENISIFYIDGSFNIVSYEYKEDDLSFKYELKNIDNENCKLKLTISDEENGIKQVDYPNGKTIETVGGTKNKIGIDYTSKIGEEYQFIITTGNGNKTEKSIKAEKYCNIIKPIGKSEMMDNKVGRVAYNSPYESTIEIENDKELGFFYTTGEKCSLLKDNNEKIFIPNVTSDVHIYTLYKEKDRTIFPIYWAGEELRENNYFNTWYQFSSSWQITYNDSDVICVGTSNMMEGVVSGFTTPMLIDLSKYKKMHMIFKTTSDGWFNIVTSLGYQGKHGNEEYWRLIGSYKKSNDWQYKEIDISELTGNYYVGTRFWPTSVTFQVKAWWFE